MRCYILLFSLLFLAVPTMAQAPKGSILLNDDGSSWLKFTGGMQVWARHHQLNPGTTILGVSKSSFNDIGIRRMRFQTQAEISKRAYFYMLIGENNFTFLSDRKVGLFLHDLVGEYHVIPKKLSIGGGLTGWNGLMRFSSPAVGNIMGIDIPLFELATIDVTDQFLRKLSLYAKGKLNKWDYRFVVSQPLAATKSPSYSPIITKRPSFAGTPPQAQLHGYVNYQFLEEESNVTPYSTGTYLGAKRIFNVGAGFLTQAKTMWQQGATPTDTNYLPMTHLAADAYYDAPINTTKGTAISAYVALSHFNFGKGYYRNIGIMNPGTGSTLPILNGSGNGYPAYGTGNILYVQAGYVCKKNLIGKTTLMPYFAWQHADYDALDKNMNHVDVGVNWLLKGHQSKLTLAVQSRPIYEKEANGNGKYSERKQTVLLQYQVFFL